MRTENGPDSHNWISLRTTPKQTRCHLQSSNSPRQEEVEVVPAKWVDDDVCRWPGGKVERGRKLAQRLADPTEDWPKYSAKLKGLFCNTIEPNEAEQEIVPGTSHLNLNPHSDRGDASSKYAKLTGDAIFTLFVVFRHNRGCLRRFRKQKQVLRQLQLMRLMIEQLSERIERAQPVQKSCGHEGKPALVKEAFTSLQDFEEFDEGASEVREQLNTSTQPSQDE
ncbi:hypothetical protein HPB50_020772 [Hyalomma asiaticum]|uniref:Uncharacterized protein n=1 Tax=Hyalomma asiaticum TaxID=266040 RepID=A0ACB7RKR9_HYAAI|nr:hypothetical protein HPB50_020772 [Hyalomma asiaticum]